MAERLLRICLIGAGGYGRTHLNTARQMEAEGLACLQDVIDPKPQEHWDWYHQRLGRQVRWHKSWEEFITQGALPDCFIIAAPIPWHLHYAKLAHATGAYVYLEKPPVPLLGQLEELIDLQREAKRIQIGFAFPFTRQSEQLREWLSSGRLGEIRHYRILCNHPRGDTYYQRASWAGKLWSQGEPVFDGPATNALAHRIHDLLCWEAWRGGGSNDPEYLIGELYRARPIESYDISSATGNFPSGASFALALSHATSTPVEAIIEIHGTKGSARLDGNAMRLTSTLTSQSLEEDDVPIFRAYRSFLRAVREKTAPAQGPEETLPYIRFTNAMLVSSGQIHSLNRASVSPIDTSRGMVYQAEGLDDASKRVVSESLNFSQTGVSWGKPGSKVRPQMLRAEQINACYRQQDCQQPNPIQSN